MNNIPPSWEFLAFLSFAISVFAAALALDMYKISRTGQFGSSWRVLITASVIFAILQASHLAELVNIRFEGLSHVIQLIFVVTLAYAFYLQRQIFRGASRRHDENDSRPRDEKSQSSPERDDNRSSKTAENTEEIEWRSSNDS